LASCPPFTQRKTTAGQSKDFLKFPRVGVIYHIYFFAEGIAKKILGQKIYRSICATAQTKAFASREPLKNCALPWFYR
jgi:hypothetical protein